MDTYAVIRSGGKQYRIREGQTLRLEKLPGDKGDRVDFDEVLLAADGNSVIIGQPVVTGVAVSGRILAQGRAKKVLVFKYKRRKRYRRMRGHRQAYTAVRIDRIDFNGTENKAPLSGESPSTEADVEPTAPESAAGGPMESPATETFDSKRE